MWWSSSLKGLTSPCLFQMYFENTGNKTPMLWSTCFPNTWSALVGENGLTFAFLNYSFMSFYHWCICAQPCPSPPQLNDSSSPGGLQPWLTVSPALVTAAALRTTHPCWGAVGLSLFSSSCPYRTCYFTCSIIHLKRVWLAQRRH